MEKIITLKEHLYTFPSKNPKRLQLVACGATLYISLLHYCNKVILLYGWVCFLLLMHLFFINMHIHKIIYNCVSGVFETNAYNRNFKTRNFD